MSDDTNYSIDLRTNSPIWARIASIFVGGRLVSPDKGSQLGAISASGTVGDSTVTDERSLQVSTIWACVRLISTAVAGLPLHVYQSEEDGRKKLDHNDPLCRLLCYQPNSLMTALEFREAMTLQLCLYGNAYAFVERNRSGDAVSIMPLMSANMDVRLENGQVQYVYARNGERVVFKPREIFHLKGFGFNGLVGLSPLAFGAKALGTTIAMEDQQREFYANGAKTPKILSTGDKLLTKDQKKAVEANFSDISNGPVRKRLWILEAGFTVQDVGMSAIDAQTIESRKFQVAELLRFYGVPPHMVGETEKSTSWGSGIEEQNMGFLMYTLKPYLDRWEYAIARSLIKPSEQFTKFAEHNIEGFLRGNSKVRTEMMAQRVNAGLNSVNEMRRLDNWPPVAGGDVITRQAQNVPINNLPNPANSGV